MEEEEFKNELLNQVENLDFSNLINLNKNFIVKDTVETFKPLHYIEVYNAKLKFVERYCDQESGEPFFENNFKINADEMNRIIDDNINKSFLHFFFCNIKTPIGNDLGLVLRFSDEENYKTDQDFNSGNDNAYYITKSGKAINFNINNFITLKTDYEKGIGVDIEKHTILTLYITYDMNNIELFKGFEHELVFEAICRDDSKGDLRLGLVVYIKDKDRKHHENVATKKNYYEGYYDAGDLKP